MADTARPADPSVLTQTVYAHLRAPAQQQMNANGRGAVTPPSPRWARTATFSWSTIDR